MLLLRRGVHRTPAPLHFALCILRFALPRQTSNYEEFVNISNLTFFDLDKIKNLAIIEIAKVKESQSQKTKHGRLCGSLFTDETKFLILKKELRI